MLNRYQGNTGRVERIDDGAFSRKGQNQPDVTRPQSGRPNGNGNLSNKIAQLLHGATDKLETDDLILLLILYLMYRESGDTELLIIMGVMLFL